MKVYDSCGAQVIRYDVNDIMAHELHTIRFVDGKPYIKCDDGLFRELKGIVDNGVASPVLDQGGISIP